MCTFALFLIAVQLKLDEYVHEACYFSSAAQLPNQELYRCIARGLHVDYYHQGSAVHSMAQAYSYAPTSSHICAPKVSAAYCGLVLYRFALNDLQRGEMCLPACLPAVWASMNRQVLDQTILLIMLKISILANRKSIKVSTATW